MSTHTKVQTVRTTSTLESDGFWKVIVEIEQQVGLEKQEDGDNFRSVSCKSIDKNEARAIETASRAAHNKLVAVNYNLFSIEKEV